MFGLGATPEERVHNHSFQAQGTFFLSASGSGAQAVQQCGLAGGARKWPPNPWAPACAALPGSVPPAPRARRPRWREYRVDFVYGKQFAEPTMTTSCSPWCTSVNRSVTEVGARAPTGPAGPTVALRWVFAEHLAGVLMRPGCDGSPNQARVSPSGMKQMPSQGFFATEKPRSAASARTQP